MNYNSLECDVGDGDESDKDSDSKSDMEENTERSLT